MKWRLYVHQSEIRKYFHKNWKNLFFFILFWGLWLVLFYHLFLPFKNHLAENYVWLELGKAEEEFLESIK